MLTLHIIAWLLLGWLQSAENDPPSRAPPGVFARREIAAARFAASAQAYRACELTPKSRKRELRI